MTTFLADARTTNGADFYHRVMGTAPRDRSLDAAYHEALNAHWRETQAKIDRVSGSPFEMLCRKMELIAEHDAWREEQRRLFARGLWQPELRATIEMQTSVGRCPSGRSAAVPAEPLRVSGLRPAAAIARKSA